LFLLWLPASKAISHFLVEFEANGNGSGCCRFSLWRIFNLGNAVGNECSDNSLRYAAYVCANLFAHNLMTVRMNSPLQISQLRFLGLQRVSTFFHVTMLVFRFDQKMVCPQAANRIFEGTQASDVWQDEIDRIICKFHFIFTIR
jgi:hypothetical protein